MRTAPCAMLFCAVIVSTLLGSTAHADAPTRVPVSVTVGGGVSLGAYQAGFLYYMTETAKRNAALLELKMVSGASAGTINALLTVLSTCTQAQDQPEDNSFWRTWSEIGFDQLFVPTQDDSAPAALSNRALVHLAERFRPLWNRGISPRCDVVLGVAATRLEGAPAVALGSLRAPRQEEKFLLRIKGRPGLPPEVHNYPDPSARATLLALPRDQTTPAATAEAYDRLKELLLASAAFPVAFPPVAVKVCSLAAGARPPAGGATACGGTERPVLFLDGGVYDNAPLRLAYRTARRLELQGKRWVFGDDTPAGATPPPAAIFALVDKDNAGYPTGPEEPSHDAPRSLLSYLGTFAGSFVAASRAREVAALYEEAPGFAPRVIASVRHFPTASGHLANFFGFFDRELRRFDFYLGMYDARRMAEEHHVDFVEPAAAEAAPFRCMVAAYADRPLPQDACAGPELAAFRILLQVSLDRLYSLCETLKDDPSARQTSHALCRHAMSRRPGEERRLVAAVPRAREARYRADPGESGLSHMMRLLAYYQMPFKDLGLDGAHAGDAMSKIRWQLGRVVEALSARQSFGERMVLSVSGKIALNLLHYAPPFEILYFHVGRGYEVGSSTLAVRFRDSTSLRWNVALQGKGLGSLVDAAEQRGPAALCWALVAGPELELYGNAVVQLRLAGRGGIQLSTQGWGTSADFARSSAGGHAALVQVAPSLTLLERLRFQGAFEQLLPTKRVDRPGWDLLFGVGWQFLSPID